jgi:DNA-binding FrmR family transcriptional regulator
MILGEQMIESYKRDVLARLKTISGHLGAVVNMVEAERYCPELMKQVSAVQASLEKVNRILLRNHLETCVSEAIRTGQGREKIDELLEALQFNSGLTGFHHLADPTISVDAAASTSGPVAPRPRSEGRQGKRSEQSPEARDESDRSH